MAQHQGRPCPTRGRGVRTKHAQGKDGQAGVDGEGEAKEEFGMGSECEGRVEIGEPEGLDRVRTQMVRWRSRLASLAHAHVC